MMLRFQDLVEKKLVTCLCLFWSHSYTPYNYRRDVLDLPDQSKPAAKKMRTKTERIREINAYLCTVKMNKQDKKNMQGN